MKKVNMCCTDSKETAWIYIGIKFGWSSGPSRLALNQTFQQSQFLKEETEKTRAIIARSAIFSELRWVHCFGNINVRTGFAITNNAREASIGSHCHAVHYENKCYISSNVLSILNTFVNQLALIRVLNGNKGVHLAYFVIEMFVQKTVDVCYKEVTEATYYWSFFRPKPPFTNMV